MPRFYETTLSITNLHNLSISTHVNRSRIDEEVNVFDRYPGIKFGSMEEANNEVGNWEE